MAREALSQVDMELMTQLVGAMEASTDPESRAHFERCAHESRVLRKYLDTSAITMLVCAAESHCACKLHCGGASTAPFTNIKNM